MTDHSRTPDFARRPEQDDFLRELNLLLEKAEQSALGGLSLRPTMPLIFIVGAPRSGTTLLLQWLAASNCFAYPTNVLSRFYSAPYIGARIQQLLTDPALDYQNELFQLHASTKMSWASNVGKTRGVLEPHEFFYYWRRFFPIDQAQKLTDEQLALSDPEGFAAGWASLERAFRKPVAAKGILLQYDITRLARWLPTAIFIHTRRDVFFNVQSLLHAREQVYGTNDAWFSVRPPEYQELKNQNPYAQVAGQVLFTNRRIGKELQALPSHRKVFVDYEDFCTDPAVTWRELQRCVSRFGIELPSYEGPSAFECSNAIRSTPEVCERIRNACKMHLTT